MGPVHVRQLIKGFEDLPLSEAELDELTIESLRKRIRQCALALVINKKSGHPTSEVLYNKCVEMGRDIQTASSSTKLEHWNKKVEELESQVQHIVLPPRFPTAIGDSKRIAAPRDGHKMGRLSCSFTITVEHARLDLKKEQMDPELHVFFSKHLLPHHGQQTVLKILPRSMQGSTHEVEFNDMLVPLEINGQYAVLRFFLYASFFPESEERTTLAYKRTRPFYNGFLHVSMIERGKSYRVYMRDSALAIIDDKLTRDDENAMILRVTCNRFEWSPDVKVVGHYSEREREKQKTIVQSLVQRYYDFVQRENASVDAIRSMHVPRMPCNMYDILLPGAMFVMDLLEDTPPENILDIALDIQNMSRQEFIDISKKQFSPEIKRISPQFHRVCFVAFRVVCIYSHMCEYTSDIRVASSGKLEEVERFIDIFTTQAGDCVAEYEEIYMENGTTKQIKDVCVGDKVLSYDFIKKQFVCKTVVNKWDKGILPKYHVKFRNGSSIDVTENHPMWMRQNSTKPPRYEKTYLSDLDPNEQRCYKRQVPTITELPYQVVDIPWLTEDHCFVIGHFMAEGCTSGYHVRTSGYNVDKWIVPRLERLQIPYSLGANGQGVPQLTFLKSEFKEFIRGFVHNSFEMALPSALLNLPPNKLQAILDGEFSGDGHFHNTGKGVEKIYSTSCHAWALQIHEMSLKLGRAVYIYKQDIHGGVGKKPIYRVHDNPNSEHRVNQGYDGLGQTSIKSIERDGEAHMYDIQVEDTHAFVFRNGIIGHNCEDVLKAIIVQYIAWTQQDTPSTDSPLYYLVKILRLFIPAAISGSAYSPSAKSRSAPTSDDLICHIWGSAIPWYQFSKWIDIPRTTEYEWESELFPWILEGTNDSTPCLKPLFAICEPEKAEQVKREMSRMESQRNQLEATFPALRIFGLYGFFKNFQDPNPPIISDFYHMANEIWVPYDMIRLGYNATTFELYETSSSTSKEEKGYGVGIKTLVCHPESIKARPVFKYTSKELEICLETIKQQHPIQMIPSHTISKWRSSEHASEIEQMEYAALDNLKRDFPAQDSKQVIQESSGYFPPYLRYFVKDVSAITSAAVIALRTVLSSRYIGFYGFDYRHYHIGEATFVEVRLFFK